MEDLEFLAYPMALYTTIQSGKATLSRTDVRNDICSLLRRNRLLQALPCSIHQSDVRIDT